MVNELLRPFMNDVIGEHRQMHTLTRQLREALALARKRRWVEDEVGRVCDALGALREHAARHFVHEEEEGCFEDAMAIMPQCAPRVACLQDEHAELLAVLDDLAARADVGADRPGTWPVLARDIENLLARLLEHERCEGRLIADVFNIALDD